MKVRMSNRAEDSEGKQLLFMAASSGGANATISSTAQPFLSSSSVSHLKK